MAQAPALAGSGALKSSSVTRPFPHLVSSTGGRLFWLTLRRGEDAAGKASMRSCLAGPE